MLFLNNPLLTSDNIIAAFEHLVTHEKPIHETSYAIYAMESLPENIKKYKNSYLWIESKLYYIKPDGQQEHDGLIISASINAHLVSTFEGTAAKSKGKTTKLTQSIVEELSALNPSHHPQTTILPPSELKQFQNKLKTIFFNNVDPVENLKHDRRFTKHFDRLHQTLNTILSLDDTSDLAQALDQLNQSESKDWDPRNIDTHFETTDAKYGYFSEIDSSEQKEILQTVFRKLSMACRSMIVLFEKTYDPDGMLAYRYAYALMALFLDPTTLSDANKLFDTCAQSAHKLLSSIQSKNNTPFQDILLPALQQLPMAAYFSDLPGWRSLIKKEGAVVLSFLPFAYKIEEKIKEVTGKTTVRAPKDLKEAQDIKKLITYTRSNEDIAFSDLCKIDNVSEERFNLSLNYMASGWPKKINDSLPDVVIPGTGIAQKFYWVKLPISDKRALILGDITKCCQSMGGESEDCVRDGCSRSDNGFYVLLQQTGKGSPPPLVDGKINDAAFEIVGQSYAWKSKTGNLCLDSIECRSSISNEVIQSIVTDFATQVLNDNPDIKFVNVGRGGNTPSDLFRAASIAEDMNQGTLYGDARAQYCIGKTPYHQLNETEVLTLRTIYEKHSCSQEFQACIEYLLCYFEPPALLLNHLEDLLKHGLEKDLTPQALKRLLILKTNPNITDLYPVDFETLDTIEHVSIARLLWRGDFTRAFPYLKKSDYALVAKALNLYGSFDDTLSPFDAPIEGLKPVEQRKVFDTIKDELPSIITSFAQLRGLFRHLEATQIVMVCEQFKSHFLRLMTKAQDLERIRYDLPREQWQQVIQIFWNELPSLVKTIEDFTTINEALWHAEWRIAFYQKMKPLLLKTPKTEHGFCKMLDSLPLTFRQTCCDEWINELPPHLLRSSEVFDRMMKHLSLENKTLLIEKYLEELPIIIKREQKSTNCLLSFLSKEDVSESQRGRAYELCKKIILADLQMRPELFLTNCSVLLELLPFKQSTDFYECVKTQLVESMKYTVEFHRIRKSLAPEQRADFFVLAKKLLWSNASSDLDEIEDFSPDELKAMMHPSQKACIKALEVGEKSFYDILLYYRTSFKQAAVFTVLKERITEWIQTPEEYAQAAKLLPQKQAGLLYECLKEYIPGILHPDVESISPILSAQDFHEKTSRSILGESKDMHQIYTSLKLALIQMTENKEDFRLIVKRLSPDDRVDFCNSIKDKIHLFTQTASDYAWFGLYPELLSIAWETCHEKLQHMVIKIVDFGILMHQPEKKTSSYTYLCRGSLTAEHRAILFDDVKDKLIELIKSREDFIRCMQELTPEQSQYIFDRVKHRLVDLVTQILDYMCMTKVLTPEQQLEFYEQVKHKLPALIKAKADQHNVFASCPKERREELHAAIILHQLIEKISVIAPEKHVRPFATALMYDDDETIKTQFHSLVQYVTLHKESNVSFHQQSVNGITHCFEALSLLDSQWIKILNAALELGLEESQFSSFEAVKQSLEQYMDKTSSISGKFDMK